MDKARVIYCPSCGAASEVPAGPDPKPCAHCRSMLHPLRCPWCFAWGFAEAKDCPACGAKAPPASGPLACPSCRVPLSARVRDQVRLSGCPACGGVWADPVSFKRLCEDRKAQTAYLGEGVSSPKTHDPSAHGIVYRPCAECGEMMNRINFAGSSGVVLDACKPHGVWFDAQELSRIVAFIRAGGLDASREKELRRLEEELQRLRRGVPAPAALSADFRTEDALAGPLASARGLLKLLFG